MAHASHLPALLRLADSAAHCFQRASDSHSETAREIAVFSSAFANLRLGDLHVIDNKVGREKGVVWGSSLSTCLRLDNQEHWLNKVLITGGFKDAVHVLLNAG